MAQVCMGVYKGHQVSIRDPVPCDYDLRSANMRKCQEKFRNNIGIAFCIAGLMSSKGAENLKYRHC